MTDFVGVAPTDEVTRRETFRIVVERNDWTLAITHLSFAAAVTDFYNNMMAKTGAAYPVSPNPVVYGATDIWQGEQSTYAIDIRIADYPVGFTATDEITITAADVVNRLNGVTPRVQVVRFQTIGDDEVTDAAARDDLAQQQHDKDAASNPLSSLGEYVTLAVIALVALAVIQISKDL